MSSPLPHSTLALDAARGSGSGGRRSSEWETRATQEGTPASSSSFSAAAASPPLHTVAVRGSLQREGIYPVCTTSSPSGGASTARLRAGSSSHGPAACCSPSRFKDPQPAIEKRERTEDGEDGLSTGAAVVAEEAHTFNHYFDAHARRTTRRPQWMPYLSQRPSSAFTAGGGGGATGHISPNLASTLSPSSTAGLPSSSGSATGALSSTVTMSTCASAGKAVAAAASTQQQQLQQLSLRRQSETANVPPWRQPSDVLQHWQELISGGSVRRRNATGSHLWLTTNEHQYPLSEAAAQAYLVFACENVLLLRSTVPLPKGRSECDCFAARVQRIRLPGGGGGGSNYKREDNRSVSPGVDGEARASSVTYVGLAITAAAGDETKSAGFPMALLQLSEAGAGPAILYLGMWRVTERDTLVQVKTLKPPQPVRGCYDPGVLTLRLVVRDGSFDVWVDADDDQRSNRNPENDGDGAQEAAPFWANIPVPSLRLGEALAILVSTGGRVSARNVSIAEGERPPESRFFSGIQRSVTTTSNSNNATAPTASATPPKTEAQSDAVPAPSLDGEPTTFCLPPPAVSSSTLGAHDGSPRTSGRNRPAAAAVPPLSYMEGDGSVSSTSGESVRLAGLVEGEGEDESDSPHGADGALRTLGPLAATDGARLALATSPDAATSAAASAASPLPQPQSSSLNGSVVGERGRSGLTREVAVQTDIHIDPGLLQRVPILPTPKFRWEDTPLPPPPPGYLEDSASSSPSPSARGLSPVNSDGGVCATQSSSNTRTHSTTPGKTSDGAADAECLDRQQRQQPPTGPFPFLRRGDHKQTTLPPEKQHTPQAPRKGRRGRRGQPRTSRHGCPDLYDDGACDSGSEEEGERGGGKHRARRTPAEVLEHLPANVDASLAEVILAEVLDGSPGVDWEDIAGLPDAKRLLKEAVLLPLLVPELFTGLVQPWRGVLLYGPPGTGKTMLAKAVAASARTTFFCVSSAVLNNKHYGESEKLVKTLFQVARLMAPSTIFFDEIDAIMSSRGGGGGVGGGGSEHEASRRVKSEMLQQMDGITSDGGEGGTGGARVLVLATTNRPGDLDEAIRRRLEKRIYIPLPDRESRAAQIQRYAQLLRLGNTRQRNANTSGRAASSTPSSATTPPSASAAAGDDANARPAIDFSSIVEQTEGYSGADLAIVVRDAAMAPVRRLLERFTAEEIATAKEENRLVVSPVTLEDFAQAIARVQPSVSPASLKDYEKWASTFGST